MSDFPNTKANECKQQQQQQNQQNQQQAIDSETEQDSIEIEIELEHNSSSEDIRGEERLPTAKGEQPAAADNHFQRKTEQSGYDSDSDEGEENVCLDQLIAKATATATPTAPSTAAATATAPPPASPAVSALGAATTKAYYEGEEEPSLAAATIAVAVSTLPSNVEHHHIPANCEISSPTRQTTIADDSVRATTADVKGKTDRQTLNTTLFSGTAVSGQAFDRRLLPDKLDQVAAAAAAAAALPKCNTFCADNEPATREAREAIATPAPTTATANVLLKITTATATAAAATATTTPTPPVSLASAHRSPSPPLTVVTRASAACAAAAAAAAAAGATVTTASTATATATATAAVATSFPHIASEPTFGIQLRRGHQKSIIKSSRFSASSSSPSMVRKLAGASVLLPRRVSFPKSDSELVTGYLEPANPWEHACMVKSISEIAELYTVSCQKHNTKPLQSILDHLKAVELNKQLRQPLLSLKSIKLTPSDCEALEEVFKRVQYKSIDLSECELDESAASALFDMIEYYEATNELNISFNACGMTHRGWVSCTYMISHSQELQVLNAEGNPISKLCAENLGHALNTSNLHTLKLEHCGLKGAPLSGLCFKLRHNRVLKELWLAHNDLDCHDADTIGELIKVNHYVELIDISNNNIRDEGLRHIVKALILQSKELERRSMLQRSSAIDDESLSPIELSPSVDVCEKTTTADWKATNEIYGLMKSDRYDVSQEAFEMEVEKRSRREEKGEDIDVLLGTRQPFSTTTSSMTATTTATTTVAASAATTTTTPATATATATTTAAAAAGAVVGAGAGVGAAPLTSALLTCAVADENDADEETVRSSTVRASTQNAGQSMLDKLLSMNSDSSSDGDGPSNPSTDTLAACCSEDTSIISDDIFESALPVANAANNDVNPKSIALLASDVEMVRQPAMLQDALHDQLAERRILKDASGMSEASEAPVAAAAAAAAAAADCTRDPSHSQDSHNNKHISPAVFSAMNSNNNINNSNNNNNNNNSNNNNNNNNSNNSVTNEAGNKENRVIAQSTIDAAANNDNALPTLQITGIFEVTAEESDCLISGGGDAPPTNEQHASSKAVDVNKNAKFAEDYDDTHSTDSAFESASEGDISRHLPEEFTRLSASLESTRLDDIAKELAIETATIATESTECLIPTPPTPPTPPIVNLTTPCTDRHVVDTDICLSTSLPALATPALDSPAFVEKAFETVGAPTTAEQESSPKVTTVPADSLVMKYKTTGISNVSLSPTLPLSTASASAADCNQGLRRSESSCAFLTQSSRNRSQSSDSLCSDNSLDGSIGSGDLNFSSSHLNEKLTKNDTLTRQQRQQEPYAETVSRAPGGLKALAVWNNNLTVQAGVYISDLLAETVSLELLNIGKNCLSNEFVSSIKDSLTKNTTLTTLGLQSAHLSAKGIETLSSILTFGGNSTLQRIDIRDNKLEVESLTTIAEALKSNTTVTQIDIDDEPKRLSVGSEEHLDYTRVLENLRSMCSRNERTQSQLQAEKSSTVSGVGKRRGNYYLGSRKISLTCHSRPLIEITAIKNKALLTSGNNKLEVKRKPGTRLRSPVPSPPSVSPSSSPNRSSRFQVFRVAEVGSPLTSPLVHTPPAQGFAGRTTLKAASSSSVIIPPSSISGGAEDYRLHPLMSTSLPTSCSLPSMATISSSSSSMQPLKSLSISPRSRSRFHVCRIDEDSLGPLARRAVPPIAATLKSPPISISKSSKQTTDPEAKEAAASVAGQSVGAVGHEAPLSTKTTETESSATITATTTTARKAINSKSFSTSTSTSIETPSELSTNNNNTTTTATTTITTSDDNTSSAIFFCSPSSSSSSTSSTSSSSTSLASNIDIMDSSSSSSSSTNSCSSTSSSCSTEGLSQDVVAPSTVHRCPIAVFSDNDITLTKNTVNKVFSTAVTAAAATLTKSQCSSTDTETSSSLDDRTTAQCPQQQRARKVSWIGNPTAVDKLLTLFHNPATIFQRSLSPESTKATPTAATGHGPIQQLSATDTTETEQHQPLAANSLLPVRKQSPSSCSAASAAGAAAAAAAASVSWAKLGSDILNSGSGGADLTAATVTTAAAVTLEHSRSFLDAASKQFRDFSKQVFRQNLSFGNEPTVAVTVASPMAATSSCSGPCTVHSGGCGGVGDGGGGGGGGVNVNVATVERDLTCLPLAVKQELKENISPEHTINEATLHGLQKFCTTARHAANTEESPCGKEAKAESSSELHEEEHQASNAATKTKTANNNAALTVGAVAGVEEQLPSHNT